LRKNFRAADTIVRYGGDEFIVVMPETDLHQANVAVERLRKYYFANWNRANGNCEHSITVTCGVAEFEPGMTAGQLIHEADRLMLAIKSHEEQRDQWGLVRRALHIAGKQYTGLPDSNQPSSAESYLR